MLLLRFAAVIVGALLSGTVAAVEPTPSVADFERLHKELFAGREAWQNIPWRLSITEAQAAAAKENKPIYMLVRSGHPLGCV